MFAMHFAVQQFVAAWDTPQPACLQSPHFAGLTGIHFLGEVSSCREQGEGFAARNCCRGCQCQACRAALLRSGQSSPHCLLLERCTGSWLLGRRSVVLPLGGLSVVHCAYLQVCEHFSFWSWGRKGQACWSLGRYGRIIPDIVEL